MSMGVEAIAQERRRQVEVEGWTPEHDAEHTDGELAWAAVCYAAPAGVFRVRIAADRSTMTVLDPWPWNRAWDKRARALDGTLGKACGAARTIELIKAGALIAAELDRLYDLEGL